MDILFSLHEADGIREGNVRDDIESVPVQPGAEVDVLAFEAIEFALEDGRAFIGQRLEVEKGTQCEGGPHGAFEVPVALRVGNREDGWDVAIGRFGVEEGVEVALMQRLPLVLLGKGDRGLPLPC